MPPRSKQTPADEAGDEPRRARGRSPRTARTAEPAEPAVADVVAVLVAHNGAAWLPEALEALAASTVVPSAVLCVDTGSTDGSAELLAAAYGDVLHLPATTGYGEAVARALQDAPESTWLWLLHDDVAVDPTTLEALLAYADSSPSAAVLGPKVRDWHDPRFLVEIGLTTDAAGHRETGLERREYDQGQHDAVRDVLAVGTAGALVRLDVWEQVGGLDPNLPVFRDDLDLGWKVNAAGHRVVVVPTARIRHARAATTGHRDISAAHGSASGLDRRHALYVLLAHAGTLRVLGLLPRLLVATLLRALALLLTRQPAGAADEIAALVGVLGHPSRLREARRLRAQTRVVPQRSLRPLFASRLLRIRARIGAFGDLLAGSGSVSGTMGALGDPGSDGSDEFDAFDTAGPGLLRGWLLRPGVMLFLGLSMVALLAERSVIGLRQGVLYGGALLAPPAGASDLWAAYGAAWHDVSVGVYAPAPPATAALAALSTVLLGKPWLAVDTLLLASVPLAGMSAYFVAGRLVLHRYLRLWVAATWALLPVATGAVAGGRLDAAVVQVALPVLALATARVLTLDPAVDGWWRAWALGAGLSVTVAFAPLLWPIASLILLSAAGLLLWRKGSRRRASAAILVAAMPLAALMPWSFTVLAHPTTLLLGQQPADADLDAWSLALLSPGGPGVPAAVVSVGILAAALAGIARDRFRELSYAAWGVALLGLAVAGLLARVQVSGRAVWPGIALQVAALGLLVVALVAGQGIRGALADHSFGWRQLSATGIAGLAAVVPVACALVWIGTGAEDPLDRGAKSVLPAFARAELQAQPGLRALVLLPRPDGRVGYDIVRGPARTLETAGLSPSADQRRHLDRIVADLLAPRGSAAAQALSTRAIRYVALRPGPGGEVAAEALDSQPGLVRRTAGELDLWRVVAPSARLTLLDPALSEQALRGAAGPALETLRTKRPTPISPGSERLTLSAGPAGRVLVLADAHNVGWRASIGDTELERVTAWGWAQAWRVPSQGGDVKFYYGKSGRWSFLTIQVMVLVAIAVLSAPGRRRAAGLEEDVDAVDRLAPVDAVDPHHEGHRP